MKIAKRLICVLLTLVLALFPVGSASAALSDAVLNMFDQNGIYYYNPQGGGALCYSGNLDGDTIMAKVVSYLKGNNPTGFVLSDNGIAGILANFQAESAFNPFRFQGDKQSGPGYGIAQFTPMDKILEPLRTDSRTANFYNTYYDLKYTYYDSATGFPKESVPMDVIDAWLGVQLDYFFGASGEFENTTVGGYRNLGGTMGLSYISSSMTAHEAMDAAQTPEDAARIFVWIMERPADKEGAANSRSRNAAGWLDYVQRMSSSSGAVTGSMSVDGSKVTIIGDSITNGSRAQLEQAMPGVDIHAQDSKQFYTGDSSNPGGITILRDLVDDGSLRDTLVYALGTNSSVTQDQAQEVVDLAGPSRKVVFVTNWMADWATSHNYTYKDYTANNNVFAKMKNDNSNVSVADWKSAVESQSTTYLSDGVHPKNPEGRELFAKIITSTVGASGELLGSCSSMGLVEGGMNESQAQKLADYYNSDEVDIAYWHIPLGRKTNCVSFSAFFVERFTSVGIQTNRSWGNGKNTAHYLAQSEGLPEGNEPRPYSVFSVTSGSEPCPDDNDGFPCGHTGIVVGVEGNTVITVEAGWPSTPAHVAKRDLTAGYFTNEKYGVAFTYLESILNSSDLSGF